MIPKKDTCVYLFVDGYDGDDIVYEFGDPNGNPVQISSMVYQHNGLRLLGHRGETIKVALSSGKPLFHKDYMQ